MIEDNRTTVDLPADQRVKQLAHDVHREGNEDVVPLLLDFYDFISEFDEESHSSYTDLDIDDPKSEMGGQAWRSLIEELEAAGVIEQHHSGTTTFTRQ